MRNQKGITLVALIITIIVMVILAGVIIVSAVADGGVIDRAQAAIRENERADVQEIIIGSYVFKVSASTNTLAYLDLEKTAEAIYINLTDNGFKLKDSSGNKFKNSEEFVTEQEDDKIDINVEGKHGEYEGTVTEEGLEEDLEIVGGEKEPPKKEEDDDNNIGEPLDLEVSQKYNIITDTSTITITPKVTKYFFEENDASVMLAGALKFEGVSNLKDLDYNLYNYFIDAKLVEGNKVERFEDLVVEISPKMENPDPSKSYEPSEQEIAAYLFAKIDWPETVEEVAFKYIYEPTTSELKISKTKDMWEEIASGKKWDDDDKEEYVVAENGTYTIKLTVDEKEIEKTIDISEIGVDNGQWIKNEDGSYTKNNTTIEIGKTKIKHEELKAKFNIKEETTYKSDWTIIGVNGNNIKVASSGSVDSAVLGTNDGRVTENDIQELRDLDIGPNDEYRKALWSYMNAVETLNIKAKDATGITTAKSITINDIYDILGEENINKGDKYGRTYSFYRYQNATYSKYTTGKDSNGLDIWSNPININERTYSQESIYENQILLDEHNNIIKVVSCQDGEGLTFNSNMYEYTFTDDQKAILKNLGISYCWLASPTIGCKEDNLVVWYGLPSIALSSNKLISEDLCSSTIEKIVQTRGVCAVVSF